MLESVACNNCGAGLDVPEGARFVTCAHCGSRLAVHRNPTAAYTEVLDRLDERTERMAGDLERIRLHDELERLDREWELTREPLLVRHENGSTSPPTPAGSALGVVAAVIGGVAFLTVAGSMVSGPFGVGGTGSPFGGFGARVGIVAVIVVLGSIASAFRGTANALTYRGAEDHYLRRREEILRRLHEGPPPP